MYADRVLVLALPVAVVVLAWLAASVSGQYPGTTSSPYSALDGEPCSPPVGYRKRKCGGETVIAITYSTACIFDYG